MTDEIEPRGSIERRSAIVRQPIPDEVLTERLRMRRSCDDDARRLALIYEDAGYLEHMRSVAGDDVGRQLAFFQRKWDEDGFGPWAVDDRSTGAFLGRIGLIRHDDWPLEPAPIEVGGVLAPEGRGRGLATEGGRMSLQLAFDRLDCHRVISITRPANVKSVRVMERLGLTYRGTARWHGDDVVWYAIDRSSEVANRLRNAV